MTPYRGRFAPSPTGPLHAGSLATALASWLDARAAGGGWIIRIEDLDPPRSVVGAAADIVETLARCGLESDEPVVFQSTRAAMYEALLATAGCRTGIRRECSSKDVEDYRAQSGWPAGVYRESVRPGGVGQTDAGLRTRVRNEQVALSTAPPALTRDLKLKVGDFVIRRPRLWDIARGVVASEQAITDVVRGADLLETTPRQIS